METQAQATQGGTPTPLERLDEIVARLTEHSDRFAKSPIEERIGMLRGILAGYRRIAERSVRAACEAKGIPFSAPRGGEEWLAGPMPVIRNLRLLIRSLSEFAARGRIRLPRVATLPNGQVTVRVYPADLSEKLLFSGFEAWVRQDPSVTEENLEEKIAGAYRTPPSSGKVCLVLGAGNVASIPAMDALYKMFVERKS
ncbi:MAG: aldehyde dehydrogenase, partial [Deltaproteobacteria bacterium]